MTLAPAPPGPPPGTGLLTARTGRRATRLLVAPGSVATLRAILAAVPPPGGGLRTVPPPAAPPR